MSNVEQRFGALVAAVEAAVTEGKFEWADLVVGDDSAVMIRTNECELVANITGGKLRAQVRATDSDGLASFAMQLVKTLEGPVLGELASLLKEEGETSKRLASEIGQLWTVKKKSEEIRKALDQIVDSQPWIEILSGLLTDEDEMPVEDVVNQYLGHLSRNGIRGRIIGYQSTWSPSFGRVVHSALVEYESARRISWDDVRMAEQMRMDDEAASVGFIETEEDQDEA